MSDSNQAARHSNGGGGRDAHPTTDSHALSNPDVRYEPRDISLRGIVAFTILMSASIVVLHLITFGLHRLFYIDERQKDPPRLPVAGSFDPAGPRLEAYNGQALEAVRAQENARTNTYGWVDQKAGIVRIPVERAMELYLERREQKTGKEAADASQR
ncbi:MAG TPA: hypothetical protein VEJ63_03385 [Planctomycetota bacterium]|nr:hypothetical protein [Planctomycetota bacterium]